MWSRFKLFLWEWRVVTITVPSVTAFVILIRFLGLLQIAEWVAYDQFMRLRPEAKVDDRLVIVGLDEDDYAEIGTGLVPDGVFANLIQTLKAQHPRAIGLDYYRNLPVEPGSEELKAIFESTPNLVGIQKVAGSPVLASPILENLGQVGANDVIPDGDNKVRRGLLSLATPQGKEIPSFSLFLALIYAQQEGLEIKVLPNGRDWQLGHATFSPFQPNDGSYIHADAQGSQILINYSGFNNHFKRVSLKQVLKGQLPDHWGRDRIILIGPFSEADKDYFYTPYSASWFGEAQSMHGVEIHAHMISQILSAALDDRPLIKSWAEPVEWLWIFVWSGAGGILAWKFRRTGKVSILQEVAGILVTLTVLLGSAFLLFLKGWWIPVIPPLVSLLVSAAMVTVSIARSAGNIRKTFGRYLSDEIVETLLERPEGLKLGGERRRITILTSDLRGFTAMSERLPPEEVLKILNFYLGHMAEVITHYQGTIDEFMGDGILVLFGAPTSRPDDNERAVACGIAMQLAMKAVNQQMDVWGYPKLEMGIGINTGEVVVGNIGSLKRTKYGVVGNQVNLTYRIESYTTGGQILISETTHDAIQTGLKVESQREVQPKGVKTPITIYAITGIGEPHNLSLEIEQEIFATLAETLPIQYAILSGKDVSDTVFRGELCQLSLKQGFVKAESAVSLPPLTNIKLNLISSSQWTGVSEDNSRDSSQDSRQGISQDIYAKVLETPAGLEGFYVYFTAKPPEIDRHLNMLYRSALLCHVA
jgi:adenylate cyclase